MAKILSAQFCLTQDDRRYSPIDLVEHEKNDWDEKLLIAIQAAKEEDGRSLLALDEGWKESTENGTTCYSRHFVLFLTNPEEARSAEDLVWMPKWIELGTRKHMTQSGKVFRAVSAERAIWQLTEQFPVFNASQRLTYEE